MNTVDVRGVADEMDEAGTVMRAEDLPGLTRCAGTAEQLGALQDALAGKGAGAMDGAVGVFGVSKRDDTASVHEASALDIVPDLRPRGVGPGGGCVGAAARRPPAPGAARGEAGTPGGRQAAVAQAR